MANGLCTRLTALGPSAEKSNDQYYTAHHQLTRHGVGRQFITANTTIQLFSEHFVLTYNEI